MYKMGKTKISSRQIWHTNIKWYAENILQRPHHCASKNRAAIKGHEQSITISTLDIYKDVAKYWDQNKKMQISHWLNWSLISRGIKSIKRQCGKRKHSLLPHTYYTTWLLWTAVACIIATNSSWIELKRTFQSGAMLHQCSYRTKTRHFPQ